MSMETSRNDSSNDGNVSHPCRDIPSVALQTTSTGPFPTSKIDLILDLLNEQNDSTFKFVLLYSDYKGPRIYTNEKCSTRVRDGSNFLETPYGSQLGPNWIQFNYSILNRNLGSEIRTDIATNNLQKTSQNTGKHEMTLNDATTHSLGSMPIRLPPISSQTMTDQNTISPNPNSVQCKREALTDFSDFWEVEPSSIQPSYHYQTQIHNIIPSLNPEKGPSDINNSGATDTFNTGNIVDPQLNSSNLSLSSTNDDHSNLSQSFLQLVNKISSKEEPRTCTCEQCGAVLASKANLKNHMRIHSGEKPFRCNICSAAYTQKSNLNLHMMKHNGIKPFQCEVCGMKFSQSGSLRVHQRTHTGERPYCCKICFKTFTQHGSLAAHERTHEGIKPYQCSVCPKSFSQKSSCTAHEERHDGLKNHECKICHSKFTGSHNLATHMRRHTGERMFQCEDCGKRFLHKSVLIAHKRTHSGEKPFQCEVCFKFFARQSSLYIHKKIHSLEKPHKCNYCDKTFKDTTGLKAHTRVHTGEKPFTCEICFKGFRQQGSLIVHRRTHSGEKPYSCGVCGKTFAQQSSALYHSRIHNGEKPCVCTLCNASFAHPGNLQMHMRRHTGEKPYLCELCGKSFPQSASLKAHIRSKHSSEIERLSTSGVFSQEMDSSGVSHNEVESSDRNSIPLPPVPDLNTSHRPISFDHFYPAPFNAPSV